MIADSQAWIDELDQNAEFVSDFGAQNVQEEAEERFNRYIELLDQVNGDEGPEVLRALIDSMRMQEDCGVYQVTLATIDKFFQVGYERCLVDMLPGLIERRADLASDLVDLIMALKSTSRDTFIEGFFTAVDHAKPETRALIMQFLHAELAKGTISSLSELNS